MGRGGLDISVVVFVVGIVVDWCDIYMDVDGVYIIDFRIVDSVWCLEKIVFEEMLEMVFFGVKVL